MAMDRFDEAAKSLSHAFDDWPEVKKEKATGKHPGQHYYPGKARNLANRLRPSVTRQPEILQKWRLAYRQSSGVPPEAFRHYFAADQILKDFDPLGRRTIDLRRAYRHARQACERAPSWMEATELRERIAREFNREAFSSTTARGGKPTLSEDTVRLP